MTDPDEITCPHCCITSDGFEHDLSCPELQYNDIAKPDSGDGMTPPEGDGGPIPYDGETYDLFTGDDQLYEL